MQIQRPPLDKDFDPIADLIVRFKVAYKVLTSKKVIVITENELDVFNSDETEVLAVCSQIVCDLTPFVVEDIKQNVKIKELLESA